MRYLDMTMGGMLLGGGGFIALHACTTISFLSSHSLP
jgi:hypothetical protein